MNAKLRSEVLEVLEATADFLDVVDKLLGGADDRSPAGRSEPNHVRAGGHQPEQARTFCTGRPPVATETGPPQPDQR